MKGRTTYEVLTGDTPNTVPYVEFYLYGSCWYLYPVSLLNDRRKLGKKSEMGLKMDTQN